MMALWEAFQFRHAIILDTFSTAMRLLIIASGAPLMVAPRHPARGIPTSHAFTSAQMRQVNREYCDLNALKK